VRSPTDSLLSITAGCGLQVPNLRLHIVQALIGLVVARLRLVEMAEMDDHNQSRHPRVETRSKKSIKGLKHMRSTIHCFPLPPFPHLRAGFQRSPLWIVTSLAPFDHHIYRASYLLSNENIRAATRSISACTITAPGGGAMLMIYIRRYVALEKGARASRSTSLTAAHVLTYRRKFMCRLSFGPIVPSELKISALSCTCG
jgi:hypothetical protein